MSIIRPILSPVLRPARPAFLIAGSPAEELVFYFLGADGSLSMINTATLTHSFVALAETASEVTVEADDAMVVSQTAYAVTLEFGD